MYYTRNNTLTVKFIRMNYSKDYLMVQLSESNSVALAVLRMFIEKTSVLIKLNNFEFCMILRWHKIIIFWF